MHYIVIDLEWNQPLNHQNRVYREVGDRLIFEMLQIGAVKMDADRRIVDSISVLIHPTCYQRIHPRIERMTHIDAEKVADAPLFADAMAQFVSWCEREGDDYLLLTWGCDDVSVLQQNLDFFDCHPSLPPMCDIQHQFSDAFKIQNRMGLQPAMERMEIEPEADRDFHNAVNDAYYTALLFQRMPDPEEAVKYAREPKQLIHPDQHRHGKARGEVFPSLADALASELANQPKCPTCGKACALEEAGYVPQAADKYIGLAKCRQHGPILCRLRLRASQSGSVTMSVTTAKATKPNVAYIHTKQLQFRRRAEAGYRFDAEAALLNADRSSVPFEE
ncbi:MAG: exonuclease domain-containing protein [Clostridia bacterium]|nr:exonuclease domain-containing protein [Clostridia bacterium]